MCAHGEMHPTFPIHWTHQCCHTVCIQPGTMPLMPASAWRLRANKSDSCLSLHLFRKKKQTSKLPLPPSTSLFHNNNSAANCAMLYSGWKCLPDPCVQLVSSQEHEIWLFLPLSSLVQPQVLLSLLHFSDRLFFPLKISLNLAEPLWRGASRCPVEVCCLLSGGAASACSQLSCRFWPLGRLQRPVRQGWGSLWGCGGGGASWVLCRREICPGLTRRNGCSDSATILPIFTGWGGRHLRRATLQHSPVESQSWAHMV